MSVLDLSGADTSGFDPVPSGRYRAEVFQVDAEETSGSGKMPAGVPMYNVQFKILERLNAPDDDTDYLNRRVFNRYPVPGNEVDYDDSKKKKMLGGFVKFLTSIGYEESEVMSKKYSFDPEDAVGRECVVIVGQGKNPNTGEPTNNVVGTKPVEEAATAGLL